MIDQQTTTHVPTFVVGDAILNDHFRTMAMIAVYEIIGSAVKEFELLHIEERAALCYFLPYGEPEPRKTVAVDLDPVMPVLVTAVNNTFIDKARVYAARAIEWQERWTYQQQQNWGREMKVVLSQLDTEIDKMKGMITDREAAFMKHYYRAFAANPKLWSPHA